MYDDTFYFDHWTEEQKDIIRKIAIWLNVACWQIERVIVDAEPYVKPHCITVSIPPHKCVLDSYPQENRPKKKQDNVLPQFRVRDKRLQKRR